MSILMLVMLLPVFFILYINVFFRLGRPIFFVQERPGLNGKIFKIYKFRSMLNSSDVCTSKDLSDTSRLTPFGKWLRSTSLDEIPELFNVIKGDMSLVGPRPLLKDYLPLYSSEQARRHEVRPGITGWAQINGRNGLEWDEKFVLDVWYVDNRTLKLDLYILLVTLKKVLNKENINNPKSATMDRFLGN